MEETESYYEQLNKYVLAVKFIPNENPVILDEGDPVDPFAYTEVEKSNWKFVFKWKVIENW